jgi:dCMP deaminase
MTKEEKYNKLYLDIAFRVAEMSYAIRKKVGCVAVKDGNIISIGWNGTPAGFPNDCESEKDGILTTLPEVLHAELNCLSKIAKSNETSEGSTMYLTLSPCFECAKLILQSGVKKVYYSEEYRNLDGVIFLKKHIQVEKI